ncbi:MAG: spore germination protein [Clostridium sp.]
MKITSNFNENIKNITSVLKVKESFDIIERVLDVHNKKIHLYFIDGFVKDESLEFLIRSLFFMTNDIFYELKSPKALIEKAVSTIEVGEEDDINKLATSVLSGQTAMIVEGFSKAILLDLRTYPARGPQEPEKEQVLRGSRDGFVETIVFNTALVRRRIRDSRLIFKMYSIGKITKTDVAIGYIDGVVDKKALDIITKQLESIEVDALTVGDQTLVECITKKHWKSPFPRIRYTERPDVVSAHVMEGKIVLFVDNSPSAMILPTAFFDFTQDIDDFYFPILTGNYLRIVRNFILFFTVFITPLYIALVRHPGLLPESLKFLLPQDEFAVPLVLQFILLEVSIDGLKLASLNTPSSLGMSLSVIGALILGEYAVNSGWFISEAILYMAIVSLASFTQPSIEMGFAIKFLRLIILVLTGLFDFWGFGIGVVLSILIVASTKTLTGEPYLYPLIPLKWSALKNLLFRTSVQSKQTAKKKNVV